MEGVNSMQWNSRWQVIIIEYLKTVIIESPSKATIGLQKDFRVLPVVLLIRCLRVLQAIVLPAVQLH